MNTARPVVVELVGVPGSGKTLATRRAIELLTERGIAVVGYEELEQFRTEGGDRWLNRCNPVSRLWRMRSLYRQHLATVMRIRWLALLHGALSRKRWRKALRPTTNMHMVERLPAEFPGRVVLLDDGFVQKLWSLLVGGMDLRGLPHVQALLADYYASTGVLCIRLDLSDDIAFARAFDRESKGRFNRAASRRMRDRSRRWFAYHHALTDRIPERSVIARLDATLAPEALAQAVAECVVGAIVSARGGPAKAP